MRWGCPVGAGPKRRVAFPVSMTDARVPLERHKPRQARGEDTPRLLLQAVVERHRQQLAVDRETTRGHGRRRAPYVEARHRRGRGHATMPAATVSFVASSTRMNAPVARHRE